MGENFTETVLEGGVFHLLSGPGVQVVAIADKSLSQETFDRAREILHESAPHPLEVRAIALRQNFSAHPEFIMRHADAGIALVRDGGESTLARARNYMERVLKLRADALTHLRHTMGGDRAPRPEQASRSRTSSPR